MCFCHELFFVWRCLVSLRLSSDDGHVGVYHGQGFFFSLFCFCFNLVLAGLAGLEISLTVVMEC